MELSILYRSWAFRSPERRKSGTTLKFRSTLTSTARNCPTLIAQTQAFLATATTWSVSSSLEKSNTLMVQFWRATVHNMLRCVILNLKAKRKLLPRKPWKDRGSTDPNRTGKRTMRNWSAPKRKLTKNDLKKKRLLCANSTFEKYLRNSTAVRSR